MVACESKPKGVQTQRRRVFVKQNPHTARPKGDGGRWGVVPASQHQEILVALASLIRDQRYEMALTVLDNEITLMQADSRFHGIAPRPRTHNKSRSMVLFAMSR